MVIRDNDDAGQRDKLDNVGGALPEPEIADMAREQQQGRSVHVYMMEYRLVDLDLEHGQFLICREFASNLVN